MPAVLRCNLIGVEEYLARELDCERKSEFVEGRVYLMPDTNNRHNLIASNLVGVLGSRIRGRKCWPFNSDTKIRVRLPTHWRFYYPDASVICRPNPQSDSFRDEAAVIVEVLSQTTRRTDEGEKKDAYLTIPSLGAYLLVEQDRQLVVVHRRTEQGFVREVYHGENAVIPLPEIETELPLTEIYDGAELSEEAADGNEPIA